tara:strand:- start:31749 stop:32576 length:828 start_codon:yes stop_codon:yes gene_type:complete
MKISEQYISIAIPTYNSSKYIDHLLKEVLKKNIVNEVILSDDNSDDYEKAVYRENIEKYKKKYPNKNLIFIDNERRRGPFVNKYTAINNCNNDIVYQIDSDNIPMLGLDKYIKNDLLPSFNVENIYFPSKIYQFQKNEKLSIPLSKFFTGTKYRVTLKSHNFEFKKELIKNSILNSEKITDQKNRRWLLNIGNFIVNKENFLDAMKEGLSYSEEYLFAADQFLITYLWLKNNKNIEVKKKHYHFHRKRKDSISSQEKDRTSKAFDYIENKILELN